MLYDASRVGNLSPNWFDPKYWEARGELDGAARGRGTTHFVRSAGKDYVLRHYRRGGLIARVSGDRYVWQGEQSTRPFEEWQLTYRLHR
ncbi:MAG: 3-deoxy-D-manno-octulosonic acid kinase, partial [Gammaproteobacteria bacterium]